MRRTTSRLLMGLFAAATLAGGWLMLRPQASAADAPPAVAHLSMRAAASVPAQPVPLAASAPVRVMAAVAALQADPLQALPADELAELHAALQHHPARQTEVRRVAGFLQLQRQVQAWGEARAAHADPALRRALADRIEAALPGAIAARSITAGEALQLQSALVAERQPDATRAEAELAAWRAQHLRTADGPDAREREFLAQQQALVAAHAQKPEQLAHALEALRQKHFAQ